MSGTQVYFLIYILRHHPGGTYITELCHEIGVSKSTLSALIKKLRKKDYLYFQEDPEDIRKKEVFPTEKLLAVSEEFLRKAGELEEQVCGGLDDGERIQLWNLGQKLLLQMDGGEHDKEKKDRRIIYREKSFTAAQTI